MEHRASWRETNQAGIIVRIVVDISHLF